MKSKEIAGKIQAFLKESYPHAGLEPALSTDLLNDWFVDSLGIVVTVAFLEETFKIDVESVDVNEANFKSVETLVKFVSGRLGPR